MVIVYLAMRLVLADGYNLISNEYGHDCGRADVSWLRKCNSSDLYVQGSIVNKVLNSDQLKIQDTLTTIAVLFSIVFFFIYRVREYNEYINHDIHAQTEEDFSLFVRNIPTVLFEPRSIKYELKLLLLFNSIIGEWIERGNAGLE